MTRMNFSWVIDGKLAGHAASSSEKDLLWLKQQVVLATVRMAEKHKTAITSGQVEKLGMKDCHEPVPDFTAPNLAQIDRMIQFINKSLADGRPVGVSCGSGLGRTGTILACYLVSQGSGVQAAIDKIRSLRPGTIETQAQEAAIEAFAQSIKGKTESSSKSVNGFSLPLAIEEAVSIVTDGLSEEDKTEVAKMTEFEFKTLSHLDLGMYIRNRFGLWQGNQELLNSIGASSADDASNIILSSVWKALQRP